jgi:hypothetical protein
MNEAHSASAAYLSHGRHRKAFGFERTDAGVMLRPKLIPSQVPVRETFPRTVMPRICSAVPET